MGGAERSLRTNNSRLRRWQCRVTVLCGACDWSTAPGAVVLPDGTSFKIQTDELADMRAVRLAELLAGHLTPTATQP